MAYNKIITSEGNVQFQTADGNIINVHPFHIYTTFNEDTVSFILIAMPKSSGLAIFTSKASDLEVDGTVYTIEQLPNALSEAFAKAGAVARYEIVDELPTSGQSNTIYLVPKEEGEGYDEYIYVNGEWELIGDTDIELDRYVDKETFSGYTADTLVLINTVSGNVITESERAISAETALQTAIDNEVSARTDADTALSGAVDTVISDLASEVSRAEGAEASLSGAIDTEIAAREAADSVISGAVDNVSTDLSNEVQRAISAETSLDSKIEIVSGQVISESERAISAETDLQTAINEEASARTADVEALSGAVDNVQDEVDILSAALEEETSARTDADSALTEAINAVDSKVDTLSGEVETMGDEAIVDAEYVSSSTTIDFYNASGTVVAQVDASDFIVDGMVDDVRIENGYLVIDFNTASGKQDISIPLTDIFDPSNYYDKTAIDGIVSGINESIDTVSGDVITEASARTDADTALSNKIDGKVVELTQAQYDALVDKDPLVLYVITDAVEVNMADYYKKTETSGATEIQTALDAKLNTSDFNTYSASTQTAINGKQATLVSGTNIKTINNESLLGSGNIDIQGGGRKAIEAGRGISITSGETADTVSFDLPISAGTGSNSIIEGFSTSAMSLGDHAEGKKTYAKGNGYPAHAEGDSTSAMSFASHAEGRLTKANGEVAHAEGKSTQANGDYSHAEGNYTQANSYYSHAEGFNTNATTVSNVSGIQIYQGYQSRHAEGCSTNANNASTHVEGYYTQANNFGEHASGVYNVSNSATTTFGNSGNTLFSVGNGTADNARHNAFEIRQNGDIYLTLDGQDVKLQDQLGGSSITVDTALDSGSTNPVENRVIYNKIDEVEQVTAAALNNINDRISEDEEVTAAGLNAVNDKFDGLKLKKLTQAEYDALATKDSNTLYIITD